MVLARKSKLARRDDGGRGRRVSCSWYSEAAADEGSVRAAAAAMLGIMEENNIIKERQLPTTEVFRAS